MTHPTDVQQWCAECGNAMRADSFGARQKCCNGWGYWAAIKPEPRDSWWPAIQQRGLYLYRNEAKWPKGMNPVLPIAGGTDRQTEEVMKVAARECKAEFVPVASAAEPQAAAPYDRCPTCTAHIPVGKTCGVDECGLRGK